MPMVQANLLSAVFLALCLVVPLTSATSTSVEYCNKKSSYPVKVSGVDITPYPIEKGKATTFSINASTDEAISGGSLVIDVYYIFGIHVYSETHDLCSETSCPISAGEFVISHTQELPGYTPPGSYTLQMTMTDANGNKLTCISFGFSVGWVESDSVADI